MNQADVASEMDFMISLMNLTTARYNFSDDLALAEIRHYLSDMYTLDKPQTIVLLCVYIPVFLLSLTGNSVVIFVVVKNKHMRRVRNVFLVNLACADLAVTLLCMPLVVGTAVYRIWLYGEFLCKFSGYLQGVAVTASIWTLVALSLDRCMAIKSPLNKRRLRNNRQAFQLVVLLWIISGLIIGPILYVRTLYHLQFEKFDINVSYCIEVWASQAGVQTFAVFLLIVMYAVPIGIITVCYSLIGRTLCVGEMHKKSSDNSSNVMLGRKRVARMLIALIGVFFVCWLPYNICSLSLDIKRDILDTKVLPFSLVVAHTHSAINPLLYWFLNKSFRSSMKGAIKCDYIRAIRDTPCPHKKESFYEVCPDHPRHWILKRMQPPSPQWGRGQSQSDLQSNVRKASPGKTRSFHNNRFDQMTTLGTRNELNMSEEGGLKAQSSMKNGDTLPYHKVLCKSPRRLKIEKSIVKADVHSQLSAVVEQDEDVCD